MARKRGRITVQHQPTGAARGMMRLMGLVHAVFGGVFVIVAVTVIFPNAGIIGIPFLAGGLFFCINGIRLLVSKNGVAHRVGYDVETDLEESIVGILEEPSSAPASAGIPVEQRLEELRHLYDRQLITQDEYDAKRKEILAEL